ncbi:polysaccharide deacetylase family protein [Chryseolinea lacunae]|uniref:Polysaccharide deacetylase family protein n=1 Tax=Chryseolinea lacunae TaxID=2801331 RepID=A0ABS1L2I7_9BACT|nr:polysaccharide deacetylase family protein [Chryseolinea lacunae]MBL0745757.1 polysaccharide deacetylase family protein [Chryseolinea lacunae]
MQKTIESVLNFKSSNWRAVLCLSFILVSFCVHGQGTFAERLGWKKGERVLIFHVDDVGMSYECNNGAKDAIDYGIATSMSIMMPCPWVPDIAAYVRDHPHVDAGLHLTFTAEWSKYRWMPVSGTGTPGLIDQEGALWDNVPDVVRHATSEEIEIEMRAQLNRARRMGMSPTHLDTHMGTLWSTPEYLDRYVSFGIKEHIPILFTAGHNTLLLKQIQSGPLEGLKKLTAFQKADTPEHVQHYNDAIRAVGERLWDGGLAVADDLYVSSYDWELPSNWVRTDENWRKFKVERYKELLRSVQPGITVILLHCADAGSAFQSISDSGDTRRADWLAMLDDGLKEYIVREGFVLTTWAEMQRRRDGQNGNR